MEGLIFGILRYLYLATNQEPMGSWTNLTVNES